MRPYYILPVVVCFLFIQACAFKPPVFTPTSVPSAPDFSKLENWAAHPDKKDMADRLPGEGLKDVQSSSEVDVFFLHPTTYTRKGTYWNADVKDAKLNEKTDESTILYQASIFNGAGKVYAPRYRQVHLSSFYEDRKNVLGGAFEVAYTDLKMAFTFFLEKHNNKRPIIIAAHSQGALHAIRLLKEFFDGKLLQKRLVAAYIVGWPVVSKDFKNIPPCSTPDQTGCVCSWRTFQYGYIPPNFTKGPAVIVTNPLSWTTDETLAPMDLNKGAVLSNFKKIFPGIADAQIHDGFLWAHKPKFPGSFLFSRKNYHIADLNFYYMDVRENAQKRVTAFWK